jgi:hypothetical protein
MNRLLKSLVVAGLFALPAMNVARADCEDDLVLLEQAYKTPNLSVDAKAALDEAKTKAVPALKKDDDDACHKAVIDGLAKAAIQLRPK